MANMISRADIEARRPRPQPKGSQKPSKPSKG